MSRPIGRRDFLRTTAAVTAAAMTGVVPAFGQEKAEAEEGREVRHDPGSRAARTATGSNSRRSAASWASRSTAPARRTSTNSVKASKETGVAIHGVIDSVHWRDTLSHPDEKVRGEGTRRAPRRTQGRQDRRGRHRAARARRGEQGRDLRAVLGALAGRGEEGAADCREARREDRHRGRVEQLHHQARATDRVRRQLQERVRRGVLRLLEHAQVRRAVRGVDPQARQADAEVRLQGLQQGEGEANDRWVPPRSARATRTGRRC